MLQTATGVCSSVHGNSSGGVTPESGALISSSQLFRKLTLLWLFNTISSIYSDFSCICYRMVIKMNRQSHRNTAATNTSNWIKDTTAAHIFACNLGSFEIFVGSILCAG